MLRRKRLQLLLASNGYTLTSQKGPTWALDRGLRCFCILHENCTINFDPYSLVLIFFVISSFSNCGISVLEQVPLKWKNYRKLLCEWSLLTIMPIMIDFWVCQNGYLCSLCGWGHRLKFSSVTGNLILNSLTSLWRHEMETFSALLALCVIHRSPVNSPHKGQRHRALMFSLICAWINSWVNNREVVDLRPRRAHYDVIVMCYSRWVISCLWYTQWTIAFPVPYKTIVRGVISFVYMKEPSNQINYLPMSMILNALLHLRIT